MSLFKPDRKPPPKIIETGDYGRESGLPIATVEFDPPPAKPVELSYAKIYAARKGPLDNG